MALVWGGISWYNNKLNLLVGESPFLQVTNRQLSLFLWQNPEFMRINSPEKRNYLPAFQYLDKVTLDLAQADQIAVAPPELIFRYHTWNRLVSNEFTERPIPKKEFQNFLSYADEWHPAYWPDAPQGYIDLVNHLAANKVEDLSTLSQNDMPMPVRIAFQGWVNYFIDKEAINKLQPTYKQMREFIGSHPHYARNYWRNIVGDHTPKYLISLSSADKEPEAAISQDELVSFLRVAIYNYLKAQNPPAKSKKKT